MASSSAKIPNVVDGAIVGGEFDQVESLLLDLLEWISPSRPYSEVMEAWRTSCPRLPVWEEANRRRFVRREREAGQPLAIVITAAGMDHLRSHRRAVEGW